jgi:DNA-binding response OmpR family regulator
MKRHKVLVVEDEATSRRMLTFNLKQQGYDVLEAEDGTQAYALAVAESPDLILLDIMMPGDNGFVVCQKIRATEGLEKVPIIVLTARAGNADRNFAFKAGADDYLTKPINLNSLNSRIKEYLA